MGGKHEKIGVHTRSCHIFVLISIMALVDLFAIQK